MENQNQEKKSTRGGVRPNAGRKPTGNRKLQISLYLEKSKINQLGGIETIKKSLNAFIDSELNTITYTQD